MLTRRIIVLAPYPHALDCTSLLFAVLITVEKNLLRIVKCVVVERLRAAVLFGSPFFCLVGNQFKSIQSQSTKHGQSYPTAKVVSPALQRLM